MKSRIVDKPKRLILSYGISGESLDNLKNIASGYNIEVKAIMHSQLDSKVSQLLTTPQLTFEPYPIGATHCILMCALDNHTVNALLRDLKTSSVDIPLKAVLTPSNKSWDFKTLLEHLAMEHAKLG
jgi:hypothetical protein